jgi:uncharacterized protein
MATSTTNTTTIGREAEHKLSPLTWASIALVVVGALNWGLVGLFSFDLVAAIFGELSILSRIVYVLVAFAGVYLLIDAARLREASRVRHATV